MSTQRYIVEGPDGKRYVIEGPAGAAPGPVGATPTGGQTGAPEGSQGFQRAGGYGPVLAGVGSAAIKGALGLRQFFGGLSPEQKAVLEQIKAEEEADPEKGWRTLGSVGGNIAMTAVPGNAVARGAQGLRFLQGAGRALPYIAQGASAGATELATSVGEGDTFAEQMGSKVKQAATAAAAAPILQKTLQVAAKPVTGMFRPSAEAEMLFKQGINPTLQQGADGRIGRFVGGLASGVTDVKTRLRDEFGNAMLKRITKGAEELPGGTGREFLDAGTRYMDDAYSQLWKGKTVNLSPSARRALSAKVAQVPPDASGARQAGEATAIVANRFPEFDKNMRMAYSTFRDRYRNPFSRDIFENPSDEVRQRLMGARDLLDKMVTQKNLTPEELAQLKGLNIRNFDLKRLEEAVAGTDAGKEGINVGRLAGAYSRMINQARAMGNTTHEELVDPAARLISKTPTQDMARAGRTAALRMAAPVIGTGLIYGTGPAALIGSVPIGLSLAGQTPAGARFLLGQGDKQKALAKLLRESEVLRALERGAVNEGVEE